MPGVKKDDKLVNKVSSSNKMNYVVGIPLILALTLIYLPNVWIYFFLTIDFLTPWKIFESPTFLKYHNFLVSRLPDQPELDIPFLDMSNFSVEAFRVLSKDYTFPVVVRGMLHNATGLQHWDKPEWWLENYGDEQILCGTLDKVRPSCTITDFFNEVKAGNPFYVSGASKIFGRNPELRAMVDTDPMNLIDLGPRVSTQLFMGLKDMGSDIHAAIGVNLFRQMAGTKRWWFIPPSQTAYLLPSINVNGFSAHTHTLVGKNGEKRSPWFNKLKRYTTTLQPGDMLMNPPWFWHGILNEGAADELVIGVPTRYGGRNGIRAALRSNWYLTVLALATIYKQYGSAEAFLNQDDVLEDRISKNREARMKEVININDHM